MSRGQQLHTASLQSPAAVAKRLDRFTGSRTNESCLAWGRGSWKLKHTSTETTKGSPGWAPATGQDPQVGTPEHLRSCTQKNITQHRVREQFLTSFPKTKLRAIGNRMKEGPCFCCCWGFFFFLSLFKGSKAKNLTLRKVSAQRGKAPWRTLQLARRGSGAEIPHHAAFLLVPAASVARSRFNGVIYSTERPLSGPAK